MALKEIWRPVPGFDKIYEVSNFGRVRSFAKGRAGLVLLPKLPDDPRRYKAVSLHANGRRIRRHVHSLVADAFLPSRPSPSHQIRHLNGDRGDCTASNLAWGTAKDNAVDRNLHGRTSRGASHGMHGRRLFGEMNGVAKLSSDAVRAIRTSTGTQRDIARRFNVTQGVVWRIIHRKAWSHVD